METPHLSRYRIVSTIGEGGMGSVHLAEDTELGRRVALKTVSPALAADGAARRRLLREAAAAAGLDHPFVCKVYDVGEHDGQPFIAMEYVEGRTLAEMLRDGPVPLPEALRLASEIAEALECAQSHGVVHRDVKPSNVMVGRDGHVKVMDFGIAKRLVSGDADPTAALTATLGPSGTLPYMSPEQLRGEPVDSRSDVFSLGLVLFELLTGRRPFARESAVATAAATLTEPTPAIGNLVTGAPPLLGHLVERMMAKDADGRVQTFRDVRNELRSILEIVDARPRPRAPQTHGWARARRMASMVGAGVLGLMGALLLWPERPALAFTERDWILIANMENLTGDPVFDRSLDAALGVGIQQSQYVNVFPESRVRDALARMQRPADTRIDDAVASEIAVREDVKGVLACSVAQIGSVYQLTARLIDPTSNGVVWSESVRARDKDHVLEALDDLATRVRRGLGESLRTLSRQHLPLPQATTTSLDALKLYADADTTDERETSIRLLEEAVSLDPDFALAHASLGLAHYQGSEREERLRGEEHVRQALALLDRLSTRERLLVTALAEDSRGNRESAVLAYRTYLGAYPDDAEVWFRMGWTLMAGLRQYAQAAEAFQRAIAIYPGSVSALVNLATCYNGLKRYPEAVDAYERAFALQPAQMTRDFVNHEYGFALVHLGELDRAAEVFERMKDETVPGKRAKGYRSSALLDAYRGRYRAAERSFGQAVAINRSIGASVSEFRDRLYLASTLWAQGRGDALDAEIGRIQSLASGMVLGPDWVLLGVKLFVRTGRVTQARTMLEAAAGDFADPTASSSVNRNREDDVAYIAVARGELALAAGRADEAVTLLAPANEQLAAGSSLESLANALLGAGRLEEAARRYEQFIDDVPLGSETQELWFRAHLRLAELRRRQGDVDRARALYQGVVDLWSDADDGLPLLQEARAGLAALP